MLDKGWKLSAINGQDNHRMNFGDTENLTCVIANNLNTNALVDAFRKHRTYSTESRSLIMHFTINNTFMGDTLSKDINSLQFSIYAEDQNYLIKEIHIISYNGSVIKKITDLNLHRIRYIYKHNPKSNETWFIIKILLDKNKLAISSPIFRQ